MYQLRSEPQEAVDNVWFERLKPLIDELGETFELLMPPDEVVSAAYILFTETAERPDLYPVVRDAAGLGQLRSKLEELLGSIRAEEPLDFVRRAYEDKITELIANIDMVLAAGNHDDAGFRRANTAVYGEPDTDVFAAACAWVRQEATQTRTDRPEMADLCDEALALVPDLNGDAARLFPGDELFAQARELHWQHGGYMDQLFAGTMMPDDAILNSGQADDMIRRVITNVGSDYTLADSPDGPAGLWSVLHGRRSVTRPTEYRLSPQAFSGIVSHEIGSHLLEATNGAHSRLRLLEIGLAGYERGNEGRAFLREQIMFERMADYVQQPGWYPTKATWEYRVAIHMIITMATGETDKQYGFSELYDLLRSLFRFWSAARNPGATSNEMIIETIIDRSAWNMLVRALKGTGPNGGAYYKDIVYLEGNIRCWRTAAVRPELILLGDLGKFDIANESHVILLEEAGILPKTSRKND